MVIDVEPGIRLTLSPDSVVGLESLDALPSIRLEAGAGPCPDRCLVSSSRVPLWVTFWYRKRRVKPISNSPAAASSFRCYLEV